MMNRTRFLFPALTAFLAAAFVGFTPPPTVADEPGPAVPPAATPPGDAGALSLPDDFFPILAWDPLHGWKEPHLERPNGLAGIAGCGFTIAGFVQPRDLPQCEQLGLSAILAPPDGDDPWFGPWRKLTDEQIEARVKAMIEQAGDRKSVLGYFLMDEPGTPSFPALGKAVAAVRKHAPGKLAYINLFPGYATLGAPDTSQLGAGSFTEYLERFVGEVHPQFLSYDNYMVQYSDDLQDRKKAASYFNDLLEVRRVALKHRLPFWNIVSSNQIRPGTPIPSPANLLFQSYTTLAAGGRGVSWYTYFASSSKARGYGYAPVDSDGHPTETWGCLQMVNRQIKTLGPRMNRLASTGVFFSSPPPVENLPLLPGRLVKDVVSRATARTPGDARLPVMVGEFAGGDGADYVMVVNLSLERSAHLRIETHKAYRRQEVASAEDGRWLPLDEPNGHWLVAGQGALIRLE